jgi:hypothetical protein
MFSMLYSVTDKMHCIKIYVSKTSWFESRSETFVLNCTVIMDKKYLKRLFFNIYFKIEWSNPSCIYENVCAVSGHQFLEGRRMRTITFRRLVEK